MAVPSVRLHQAGDQIDQCGFARARVTDDDDELAFLDGEIDVLEHFRAIARRSEAFGGTFDFDKRHIWIRVRG
jgi:hypothetical protein